MSTCHWAVTGLQLLRLIVVVVIALEIVQICSTTSRGHVDILMSSSKASMLLLYDHGTLLGCYPFHLLVNIRIQLLFSLSIIHVYLRTTVQYLGILKDLVSKPHLHLLIVILLSIDTAILQELIICYSLILLFLHFLIDK